MKKKTLMMIIGLFLTTLAGSQLYANEHAKVTTRNTNEACVRVHLLKHRTRHVNNAEFIDTRYQHCDDLLNIIFTSDECIKNVQLLEVEKECNQNKQIYYNKEVIYMQPTLNKNESFVFKTGKKEVNDHLVLSYQDTDGKIKQYRIGMNTDKHTLFISPIKVKKGIRLTYFTNDTFTSCNHILSFTDPIYHNSDQLITIALQTEEPIYDVCIHEVNPTKKAMHTSHYQSKQILYKCKKLNKNETLLYDTELFKDHVTRVISFKDQQGKQKAYAICMHPQDTSLCHFKVQLENLNIY